MKNHKKSQIGAYADALAVINPNYIVKSIQAGEHRVMAITLNQRTVGVLTFDSSKGLCTPLPPYVDKVTAELREAASRSSFDFLG
jgi:hypothetical protein